MKKLALIALAASMVVSGTGIASAQYYDPGYRDHPLEHRGHPFRCRRFERADVIGIGL